MMGEQCKWLRLCQAFAPIHYVMNSTRSSPRPGPDDAELAGVVERNIEALVAHRRREDEKRSRQERIADAITRFTGSMRFVYIHLVVIGVWIAINLGWLPFPKFDPSFFFLAMLAAVEAIFLSTFVLISQNHMNALADKRADLDLQISLLAEHEITRLLKLVTEIAARTGVDTTQFPELDELSRDVRPEAVLDTIDTRQQAANGEAGVRPG